MTSLSVSPVSASAAPTESKGDSARDALRKRIDGHVEALAKAVDMVRASDEFKAYLEMQARFHSYSWHNALLILSQCPSASRVAGYKSWQKLGRQVRKGERGIRIFAPCPWKREHLNESTGESETVSGLWFKVVSVFDVGQTDGEALPEVEVPNVESAADELLGKLRNVAVSRGITVTFGPISGGAFGLSKHGAIDVDNSYSTGQQAKTLAHELAHEALHWEDRGTFTRSLAELEAESVAFVVCQHFGLDVEVRASKYIALWQGDAKGIRESLERIAKTARAIIDEAQTAQADTAIERKAVA